jgi:hypothetical protein
MPGAAWAGHRHPQAASSHALEAVQLEPRRARSVDPHAPAGHIARVECRAVALETARVVAVLVAALRDVAGTVAREQRVGPVLTDQLVAPRPPINTSSPAPAERKSFPLAAIERERLGPASVSSPSPRLIFSEPTAGRSKRPGLRRAPTR